MPCWMRRGSGWAPTAGLRGAVGAALLLGMPIVPGGTTPHLSGQQVVELPGADRRLELRLEELYAVGGLDAEPWEEFQAINGAAFGPDGRLYLLDARGEKVVAVSPAGDLLHRVGRPGEGPGEHESPSGLAALPDGRLAVWDFGKRAFLLFDEAGGYIDEVRPAFSAGVPDDPFAVTPDGRVLGFPFQVTMTGVGLSYLSGSGVKEAREGLPLLRVPLAEGARTDVFVRADLQRWSGNGAPPLHRAFQPWPSWGALADGRIALYQSEDYRIDVIGPDGTVERSLRRPLDPRQAQRRDERAYADDLRRRFERGEVFTAGGGAGGSTARRVREQLEETWFYPRITPVLEITADGADHVWVQRRNPDDPTRPGPIDVLAMDGHYLGTLPVDGPGLPLAFGPDGLVVFVETDAFDIPTARVYRLPPELR